MLKIACISDTHGNQPNIPSCDILIHAGDLTNIGSISEVEKSLSWLSKQDADTIIFVPGNHDGLFEKDKHLARSICQDHGIELLINEHINVSGLNIWGSPITPAFCNWFFNADPEELEHYWSLIPKDTDILITHGPAKGILDKNLYGTECGCPFLSEAIKDLKQLKYHIFGHIHLQNGYQPCKSGYIAVNASLCTEKYECINPVQVFDIY